MKKIVAIDGPAGAGKSTVAKLVAKELGYTLVDTGALYRGAAVMVREAGVDWKDVTGCEKVVGEAVRSGGLRLDVGERDSAGVRRSRVLVNGRELGEELRSPEVSLGASEVSAYPGVREVLLEAQRSFGRDGGVVLEGRDIGTVVFPEAEVKVFLTARVEVRAKRRWRELEGKGVVVDYDRTLEEVEKRDRQDRERAIAPLRAAVDAVTVDSSEEDVEAVVRVIVGLVRGE